MNSAEKKVVNVAADLIERELEAGRDVKIPGFGRFYLSRVKWLDNDTGAYGTVNTVRFRPFKRLKESTGNRSTDGTLGSPKGTWERKPGPPPEPQPERQPAPVFTIHRS